MFFDPVAVILVGASLCTQAPSTPTSVLPDAWLDNQPVLLYGPRTQLKTACRTPAQIKRDNGNWRDP